METLDLEVQGRHGSGKGSSRSLRRQGRVPAIIYGPKMDALAVTLEAREFEKKVGLGSHSHLLRLSSQDGSVGEKLVLVKDVQRDPVTRGLLHADLYEVNVHERIRVDIALNFVGKAVGVDVGGILQPIRRSIEVLCLPMQIPDEIDVDVSRLGIHDAIHISDLVAPEGVEIPYDADITLVTVLPPVVEEARGGAADSGTAAESAGEKKEEPAAG